MKTIRVRTALSSLLALFTFTFYISMIPLVAYACNESNQGATTGAEAAQPAKPDKEPVLGPPAKIIVHRVSNSCEVYDKDNQLIKTLVVSTGREHHRTPLGNYTIYEHSTGSGYHLMVDGTYGRWCMRFKKGGYMFHSVCYAASGDKEPIKEEVDALGTSVSRGCVRLSVADAEWLYNATSNGCSVSVVDD